MRFMPRNNNNESGFTLVEMLVIAPVAMVAIGGFIALMIAIVGDVLISRESNTMTYDTQSALNRIEADILLSAQFLTTTDTLPSPQGSNNNFNGTSAFTNNNALILSTLATNENPANSTRMLVNYANQPNPCGSKQTFNRILFNQTIYFIKDNALWRRTFVPTFNNNTANPDANTVCTPVWQQNSCSPGQTATRCQTNDERLLTNVTNFSFQYYSTPRSNNPAPATSAKEAQTIEVTLAGGKTAAGQDVTSSGSLRATRINDLDSSLPPPPAPTLSYSLVGAAGARFSWNRIPIANTYEISYNVNGGAWTTNTLNAETTSFVVNASRNATISFRIIAKNAAGDSPQSTISATMPPWASLQLQGWNDYGGGYTTAAYTRTNTGLVMLKGLIKDGNAATNAVITTLPEGYRPTERLIFQTSTYTAGATADTGIGRVDIMPNGEVRAYVANNTWLSLDGVSFMPDGASMTWNNLNFTSSSGWTNFGSGYATARIGRDSINRIHLQGVIKPGTTTNGTSIASLPATFQPARNMIINGKDTGTVFTSFGINSNNTLIARGTGNSYMGMQTMYYPSTYTTWTNLSLLAGWIEHSTALSSPQYTKSSDGVVTLKGSIKSGNVAANTVIATLPAGFRPAERVIGSIPVNGPAYGRVDILANGNIIVRSASATLTTLDSISFIAD